MNVTILYNKAKCINCCHPHGQKYVSCGLTIDEKKYIYIYRAFGCLYCGHLRVKKNDKNAHELKAVRNKNAKIVPSG